MSADEISEKAALDMLGQANVDLILKMLKACLDGKTPAAIALFEKQMPAEPNLTLNR